MIPPKDTDSTDNSLVDCLSLPGGVSAGGVEARHLGLRGLCPAEPAAAAHGPASGGQAEGDLHTPHRGGGQTRDRPRKGDTLTHSPDLQSLASTLVRPL